jgi:hypothetical protein
VGSYTDNSDGTVKDNSTGLIWQKCSRGQNNDASCSGSVSTVAWDGAVMYCTSLPLAGKTWRLPNINELGTLVDTSKASGATIDTTIFPATVTNAYWSSTSFSPTSSLAWYVKFDTGDVENNGKSNFGRVRCVSGP